MGTTQTVGRKVVQVALIGAGVAIVGYLVLLAFIGLAMQEPDIHMDVVNKSGRPLLIEQAAEPLPGATRQSMLVWRRAGWEINRQCEQDRLMARDLKGAVVASRDSACASDTWTITEQGLPAAPRYQREPAPTDRIEVRLVLSSFEPTDPVVVWWRALPRILEQAADAGTAAGMSVHGPFLENDKLVLYLRGPDAATVLEFARTQVLRPSPGRVHAYVSARGEPAPRTGTPVPLEPTTAPIAPTR